MKTKPPPVGRATSGLRVGSWRRLATEGWSSVANKHAPEYVTCPTEEGEGCGRPLESVSARGAGLSQGTCEGALGPGLFLCHVPVCSLRFPRTANTHAAQGLHPPFQERSRTKAEGHPALEKPRY